MSDLRMSCCLPYLVVLLALAGSGANATTNVSGTLTGTTQWTASASPYRLMGTVTVAVGATLQIDPGVTVLATPGCGLNVLGTLLASASPAVPISFVGFPATVGIWPGLYFASGSSGTLSGVSVQHAVTGLSVEGATVSCLDCSFSRSAQDGVLAWGAARLTLERCALSDNQRRGLYLETVFPTGSVNNCTFTDNGEFPLLAKANCLDILGTGLTFSGNGRAEIGVSCSAATDIERSQTWRAQPLPFNLTAGSSSELLIPAGVTLTIQGPAALVCGAVQVFGTLNTGDEGPAQVILKGPQAVAGSWPGITLNSGASANLLSTRVINATTAVTCNGGQVTVRKSRLGDSQLDGLSATAGSSVIVDNSRLSGNGRYGLRLLGACTGGVTAATFEDNGNFAVYAAAANVPLLGAGNLYRGNAKNAIGVAAGGSPDLATSALWSCQQVPYDLTALAPGVLTVGPAATLTLESGAVVLGGAVVIQGKLLALAARTRPIRFLASPSAVAGAWAGLTFDAGSSGRLENCEIRGATTGVVIRSASPILSGVRVTDSSVAAVDCQGTSAPIFTGCQISDNRGLGVAIHDSASPDLGDLTHGSTSTEGGNIFGRNSGYDVANYSAQPIPAQNNAWGVSDAAALAPRLRDGVSFPGVGLITVTPLIAAAARPAPRLSWTGEAGYGQGAVSPTSGAPTTLLRFRVKFASAVGAAPIYVRLHLRRGPYACPGSPFLLGRAPGGKFRTGVIYGLALRLPAGRDYAYWIEAADPWQTAVGPPTSEQAGPVSNTAPTLSWTGEPGYTSGGVNPETGTALTPNVFRVRYADADGDYPTSVLLRVRSGGVEIPLSPLALNRSSGDGHGAVYQVQQTMPVGLYEYRFTASDGLASATGTPTGWQTGPTVTSAAGVMLSSASLARTRGGPLEVRCRLLSPATVQLRLLNVAGRTVAVYPAPVVCGVGERVVLWPARTATGAPLPAGNYWCEVLAADPTGARQRLLAPVSWR
ncbi:MAG TPA: right-handed parallel beta-helix repeat-containing protein [Armatimonadota bacterium]|jgi:hypothetical protein